MTATFDRSLAPLAAWVLLAVGGGLICWGGLIYSGSSGGPAIQVRPSTIQLGEIEADTIRTIAFELHNSGRRPVHILGASSHCNANGCVSAPTPLPLVIPPGETRGFTSTFKVRKTGPIADRLPVYTDAPGQPEIAIIVEGVAVATKKPELALGVQSK